jgi:hypothetical protein
MRTTAERVAEAVVTGVHDYTPDLRIATGV